MNTSIATSLYQSKHYKTNHGVRANTKVKLESGEIAQIWWDTDDEGNPKVRKQDKVQVEQTKSGFKIVTFPNRDEMKIKPNTGAKTSKKEVAINIKANIALYKYIFNELHGEFRDIHPTDEWIGTRATMIFLQTKKENNI